MKCKMAKLLTYFTCWATERDENINIYDIHIITKYIH